MRCGYFSIEKNADNVRITTRKHWFCNLVLYIGSVLDAKGTHNWIGSVSNRWICFQFDYGYPLRPLVTNAYQKNIFLFLNQNICFGCSKEPSQWDGSFEHPKHILKIMGKKIFTLLRWKNCLSKPMLQCENWNVCICQQQWTIHLSHLEDPYSLLCLSDSIPFYHVCFFSKSEADPWWDGYKTVCQNPIVVEFTSH